MKRSYAIRSPLSSTASFAAGSISTTVVCGVNSMSRAASSSRNRCETSSVTGTGFDIGARTRSVVRSRIPRSTSWSWRRKAPSNGAGGHLNGWPRIARRIVPPVNAGSASRSRSAPGIE